MHQSWKQEIFFEGLPCWCPIRLNSFMQLLCKCPATSTSWSQNREVYRWHFHFSTRLNKHERAVTLSSCLFGIEKSKEVYVTAMELSKGSKDGRGHRWGVIQHRSTEFGRSIPNNIRGDAGWGLGIRGWGLGVDFKFKMKLWIKAVQPCSHHTTMLSFNL